MDLPYLKTISQIFYQLQNSRYIAEIKTQLIGEIVVNRHKKSRAIADPASGDLARGAIHVILYEL